MQVCVHAWAYMRICTLKVNKGREGGDFVCLQKLSRGLLACIFYCTSVKILYIAYSLVLFFIAVVIFRFLQLWIFFIRWPVNRFKLIGCNVVLSVNFFYVEFFHQFDEQAKSLLHICCHQLCSWRNHHFVKLPIRRYVYSMRHLSPLTKNCGTY